MALQDFATDVSMSFKDINTELGVSSTSLLDFQGAAASFSGIRDTETTEGFGALAVELKEFYGKTFSAGSGTYGTRNAHTLRFLTDDGGLRAYGGGELVYAAEAVVSPLSINGTVGTTNLSRFVDDYIDDDLTVGDDIYNASTGTGVFDNSSHIVNSIPGDTSKYYCDDTADKVFRLQSSGNVAVVFDRKPATPTVSEVSKTDSQIVVNVNGDTRVTRTLRVYLDGSSHTTYASGSALTAGNSTNTNITKQHTFSSLSAGQSYAIKARYENAFANGDDSNTLNITTNAGATAWSNIFTDPTTVQTTSNNELVNGESAESAELTIDLANGTGTTSVSIATVPDDNNPGTSNPKPTLEVKIGTSSGNYGSYATSHTGLAAASRYFMKFRVTENASQGAAGYDSATASPPNITVTFTNNGVSATPKIRAIIQAAQ
jgi:hypothetical protein